MSQRGTPERGPENCALQDKNDQVYRLVVVEKIHKNEMGNFLKEDTESVWEKKPEIRIFPIIPKSTVLLDATGNVGIVVTRAPVPPRGTVRSYVRIVGAITTTKLRVPNDILNVDKCGPPPRNRPIICTHSGCDHDNETTCPKRHLER